MFQQASSSVEGVVVESFKEFERSWCAQVAIDASRIVYLGAPEQVCSVEGRWLGNYYGVGHQGPPELEDLALRIAEVGRAVGFRGFAGFDIGVDKVGQYWVFDLNFRACGSLVQLLFHADVCFDASHAVSRNVRFESPLEMSIIVSRLDPFIQRRQFIPTGAFDGRVAGEDGSQVVGYIVASDKEEVEELGSRMRSAILAPCETRASD
jgi:hypothetical protein